MSTSTTKKRVTFADPAPTPNGHSSLTTCSQNTVVNGSSPLSTVSGQTEPHGVRCVCLSNKESGHMIECEHCLHWCHSKCIGISQPVAKNYPFICPYCTRSLLQEVSALRSKVSSLTSEIAVLQSQLSSASQTSQSLHSSAASQGVESVPRQSSRTVKNPKPSQSGIVETRKYNLVLSGIPEAPSGQSRSARAAAVLERVSNVFSEVLGASNSLPVHVRDYRRLGKYQGFSEGSRPRPVLVTLDSALTVDSILSKASTSSQSPVKIRRDLPFEDRQAHALLMKERWALIQSGTTRGDIKIRKHSLLVNGQVHGSVVNGSFTLASPNSPSLKSPQQNSSIDSDSQYSPVPDPHHSHVTDSMATS